MKRGQITVFLSLILCIVLSVLLAGIESARTAGMRLKLENAMDMGLYSVFAEYNRELLEHYDLYFIDTSYGSGHANPYYTGEHLRSYMDYNLKPNKELMMFRTVDYTGLTAEKAEITGFSLATDSGGDVFKRQAIHYVKDLYGISAVSKLRNQIRTYQSRGIGTRDVDGERENAQRRLKEWKPPSEEGQEERAVTIDNPADSVNEQRSGILSLVLDEGMTVSNKKFRIGELVSSRKLQSGDGIAGNSENLSSPVNELLFGVYIEKKFASYTNPMKHEAISYEMEYILGGEDSDAGNLKKTTGQLLKIREAANVIYLLSSARRQSEAKAAAAAIAAAAGFPALTPLIQYTLIFAWAFIESIIDVRGLLKGEKVPLLKTDADWNFSIGQIQNFKENIKSTRTGEKGLSYNEYLQILLYFQNKKEKVFRCMDVIELNLRKTAGNIHFLMDGCMEYLEAEITAVSSFNNISYKIKRDFGYEKR